jgi:hypothetical protein
MTLGGPKDDARKAPSGKILRSAWSTWLPHQRPESAAGLASTERALRLKYHRLFDGAGAYATTPNHSHACSTHPPGKDQDS